MGVPNTKKCESNAQTCAYKGKYFTTKYDAVYYTQNNADTNLVLSNAVQVKAEDAFGAPDRKAHFFYLATTMTTQGGTDAVDLLVMQGLSIKTFSINSIDVYKKGENNPTKVCITAFTDGTACGANKDYVPGDYKYSVAALQRADCPGCTFSIRNLVDVSTGYGDKVYFNGNMSKTVSVMGASKEAIKKMTVVDNLAGELTYVFPTFLNVNNEQSLPNGATVTAKAGPSATQFYLDYTMQTPGLNKFVAYDPDVTRSAGGPAAVTTPTTAGAATLVPTLLSMIIAVAVATVVGF